VRGRHAAHILPLATVVGVITSHSCPNNPSVKRNTNVAHSQLPVSLDRSFLNVVRDLYFHGSAGIRTLILNVCSPPPLSPALPISYP
jgi:hypothetical protein